MDSAFTVGYDIIKTGFCDIQESLLTTGGSISVEICLLFVRVYSKLTFWRIGVYKKP